MGKSTLGMEFDEVPCKDRPRFDPRSGRTYTPEKTRGFEQRVKYAWASAHGYSNGAYAGPVSLIVTVQRPIAKSRPKSHVGRCDLSKPDWDNIGKLFCDALNGIAFKDDSQVFHAVVLKLPRSASGQKVKVNVEVTYYEEIEKKGQ